MTKQNSSRHYAANATTDGFEVRSQWECLMLDLTFGSRLASKLKTKLTVHSLQVDITTSFSCMAPRLKLVGTSYYIVCNKLNAPWSPQSFPKEFATIQYSSPFVRPQPMILTAWPYIISPDISWYTPEIWAHVKARKIWSLRYFPY